MLWLVAEQPLLVNDRNQRTWHVIADLVRPLDLENCTNDPFVETDVIHERRRTGRCADAVDAFAAAGDVVEDPIQAELRGDDAAPEGLAFRWRQLPLLGCKDFRHAPVDGTLALPRRVHADRTAVGGDSSCVEDLEAMHRQ